MCSLESSSPRGSDNAQEIFLPDNSNSSGWIQHEFTPGGPFEHEWKKNISKAESSKALRSNDLKIYIYNCKGIGSGSVRKILSRYNFHPITAHYLGDIYLISRLRTGRHDVFRVL